MLKVRLPAGVVGIHPTRDFDMARDREPAGGKEMHRLALPTWATYIAGEHPPPRAQGHKAPSYHPAPALVGMAPVGPPPQRLENRVIHRLEDFGADDVAMVHCPAPEERIQQADERAGCRTLVGLDHSSDFP